MAPRNAKGKQTASINTQASQAVGQPVDQLVSPLEGSSPEETHTLDFPPLPDSPLATGTMEQGRTQAEISNSIDALLTAVTGLIASQQSQRNDINALIEELRRSRAPSTPPHLNDTEPPPNLPPLPESPLAAGNSRMEQGRTHPEGTASKSTDALSTTVIGLTTSQQSQRYEIEAQKGQINAPIDELRKPRALSTTPESPPNRDHDLHEVEDVITPPLGPKFHTVKDTAGTFTLSASLLRVQALQCSTPSRSDENITPISIPLQISAQGGVRSESTAPKARAASLLAQSNSKSTPKIVAMQKRLLLYLSGMRYVEINISRNSGRLPKPVVYTDTDWGGFKDYARDIAGRGIINVGIGTKDVLLI
ncbi:hypothetical protein V8E54_008996 [Elaphomyces granulatus]